jgi:hypothetical protein
MTPDTSQPKVVSPRPEGSVGTEAQRSCGPAAPAADYVLVPREITEKDLEAMADAGNGRWGNSPIRILLSRAWAALAARYPTPPAASERVTFQARVHPWMLECFGKVIAADRLERNDRFAEEAIELLQANNYPRERIVALIEYVYSRPVGEPSQETGGVMVTLAALCNTYGIDMHAAGETELARILQPEMIAKIRAKQAAKPTGSALPVATPAPAAKDDASGAQRCVVCGAKQRFRVCYECVPQAKQIHPSPAEDSAKGGAVSDAMVERACSFMAERDKLQWPGNYTPNEQEDTRCEVRDVLRAALQAAHHEADQAKPESVASQPFCKGQSAARQEAAPKLTWERIDSNEWRAEEDHRFTIHYARDFHRQEDRFSASFNGESYSSYFMPFIEEWCEARALYAAPVAATQQAGEDGR